MVKIEKAWFEQRACQDNSTTVSSRSLRIDSFWGLFIIVGSASSLALIIFFATILYEHRRGLRCSNPENSREKDYTIGQTI